MDQENSEGKPVSENDERDWMKAKKFWKPGKASARALPTTLIACHLPEAHSLKPWHPNNGVRWGMWVTQHLVRERKAKVSLPGLSSVSCASAKGSRVLELLDI